MWTSSALRVAVSPGQPARANVSLDTTADGRSISAIANRCSMGGSATHWSPRRSRPSSSSSGNTSTPDPLRRVSASRRARRSRSSAGSRIQSSNGSPDTGAGARASTRRSRGRLALFSSRRFPSSSGQRTSATSMTSERNEATFPDCFVNMNVVPGVDELPIGAAAELAARIPRFVKATGAMPMIRPTWCKREHRATDGTVDADDRRARWD